MLDCGFLNHIEHINLRRENFRECNRIGRCIGGRRSKVGCKKNSLEREHLWGQGPNVGADGKRWPAGRPQDFFRDRANDSPLEAASAMRSQNDHGWLMHIRQIRNHIFRVPFEKDGNSSRSTLLPERAASFDRRCARLFLCWLNRLSPTSTSIAACSSVKA